MKNVKLRLRIDTILMKLLHSLPLESFLAIYHSLCMHYLKQPIPELSKEEKGIFNFIIENNGKEYKDYSVVLFEIKDYPKEEDGE